MTFLYMYEKNKCNYIIIKNLLDNKMIFPKLEIFMELHEFNEMKDKIYAVMWPLNDISISRYRETKNEKIHKRKINSVILYDNYLVTFSEDKTIKILDKKNFKVICKIKGEFNLPIYTAIKIKYNDILIGYGNLIKIISLNIKEKKIIFLHIKLIWSHLTIPK